MADAVREKRALGVLVSGRGSNLQAIIDAIEAGRLDADIKVVVSNLSDAYGLERARQHGIPTEVVPHKRFRRDRAGFEAAIAEALDRHGVHYVVLAGFMRILSAEFIARYPHRIINIHPALLPSFPGLHGQAQAFDYGVKFSGATVHFVDASVDGGPIIAQAVVPVLEDDDEDRLAARILEQEHQLFPKALDLLVEGRLRVDGRRVHVMAPPDAEGAP